MFGIEQFTIKKLFGSKNVSLKFENKALIFVGPNGIGKSTITNIFYFFVSLQWERLAPFKFKELEVIFEGKEKKEKIVIKYDDIAALPTTENLFSSSPRTSYMLQKLVNDGSLEDFINFEDLKTGALEKRKRFARILGMPIGELQSFQRHVSRHLAQTDFFSAQILRQRRQVSEMINFRVLYLPTYRRIEKDIKDIFPGFDESFKRYSNELPSFKRREGANFIELVSFGMEDVKLNLEKTRIDLSKYSLEQYNNLSASYLKDVIHGKAKTFKSSEIKSLTDEGIQAILSRVNDETLSIEDKKLLTKKIKGIQLKNKKELEDSDQYLAHYFSKIVSVHEDIKERERHISDFVSVCNEYLNSDKRMVYDDVSFTVNIFSDDGHKIDFSSLSSGEKQVVSLFSHLYLEDENSQIVIIDEPELSLSVPWQKRFLPDVINSKRCGFLLAVTHSPFIFDNQLADNAVDLRDLFIK